MAGTSITKPVDQQVEVKNSPFVRVEPRPLSSRCPSPEPVWSLKTAATRLRLPQTRGDRVWQNVADGRPQQQRRWWKRVRPRLQVQTSAIPLGALASQTAGTVLTHGAHSFLRPGQGPSCLNGREVARGQ